MNLIMESTILMSAWKNVFVAAKSRTKFGGGGARKFQRLQRRAAYFFGGGGANMFPAGAVAEFGGSGV